MHVVGVEGSRVVGVVGCPYPVVSRGQGLDILLGEVKIMCSKLDTSVCAPHVPSFLAFEAKEESEG